MHPQMYIRKAYNSNVIIDLEKNEEDFKQKQYEPKSINPILKLYPSLKNNLKSKPITSNGNLSISSYKR
jgi:hypothetical protein